MNVVTANTFNGALNGNATSASNSLLFYGLNNTQFLRSDANDDFSGELISTNRANGIFGVYNSTLTDSIWSMGTSYKNNSSGANFGNLYGAAYKHTNNSTGGTMGGGHQMVWCDNGTPRASMGYSAMWHAQSMQSPIYYDSNNTGYYADMASTSVFNDLRADIFYDKDNTSYYMRPGTTSMFNDLRANIFYDRANTGYYTKPATTSHMNIITTAGSVTVGASNASNLYLGAGGGTHMRIHTSGGNSYFDLNNGNLNWRNGSSTRFIFYNVTANMTVYGTVTQYSDKRHKENIVEIGNCIDKIKSIRGVYYNRTDLNTETTKIGVIAQEVEVLMPELVLEEPETGFKSVAYSELTAVLVNGMKEQQAIIEDLKARLEILENK